MTGCSSMNDETLEWTNHSSNMYVCWEVSWRDTFDLTSVSPSIFVVVIKHWLFHALSFVRRITISQGISSPLRTWIKSPTYQVIPNLSHCNTYANIFPLTFVPSIGGWIPLSSCLRVDLLIALSSLIFQNAHMNSFCPDNREERRQAARKTIC